MKNGHIKIFEDKKVFKKYEWRGLVSTCPHCQKEPPEPYSGWRRPEFVDGLYIKLDAPQWKTDSAFLFSSCPVCTKKSWVHFKLDGRFYMDPEEQWPESIKEALINEHRARLHKAMRDWNASPCRDCAAVERIDTTHLYFARGCAAGSGGPLKPGEACAVRIQMPVQNTRRKVK